MTTFAEIKSEIANWRTFTIIVFFSHYLENRA